MAEKSEPELPPKQHGSNRDFDRSGWNGPRTVIVPRSDNGFGFTLRHFIVYPPETAMDEQDEEEVDDVTLEGQQRGRRAGSLEPMDTIFVKQVKEGGPAELAGLRTGDRIVSVNGESVTGKTYSQVIALIQSSDSSLKLLVVPRDEDILQMAYQNSAYNQGQEPYKGHAREIPDPPPMARGQKSSMAPRFKSELSVMPEEEHREPLVVGTVVDHAYSAPPQAHPPTPVRTSSKNVVLSHIQNMGGLSPSSENVNNYSDNTVTSSTDSQPSQNGQAAAKSRAPYLQYRPTPYTRSQTTSSLQRGTGPEERTISSSTSSLPSSGRSNSLPVSHLFTSSTYVEPYTQPYDGSTYTSPQSEDLRQSRNMDSSSPSKSRWTHHSISAADPNKMGGTVTVRFHDSSGGVQQMELPRYQGSGGQDHGSSVIISTSRHSIPDQYGINLVSDRMRKFDSADSIESSGSSQQRFLVNFSQPSDVPSMGMDSVASRIAQYESGYSDGSRSDDERFRPRRYSADDQQRNRYGSPLAQARPPDDVGQMTSSPPATISIYFRSDHVPSPTTKLQPSPERLLRQAHSQDRDLGVPVDRISRDRSPLGLRDQYFSPPHMRRTNKPASRQPSYLSAVNAPHSQGGSQMENSMPEVVGSTCSTQSTTIGGTTVVMRQYSTPEEREAKLFRRTSYLMATGKDSAKLGGMADIRQEMSKSDSHLLPSQIPSAMIEPVQVEEVHCAPPPLPPIAVPEIVEDQVDSSSTDENKKRLSVDISAAKLVPDESKDEAHPTTPPKASNIRKLKAFFGEKTPRIHEVTTDRSRIFDMPKPGETVKEGMLSCKMAIADGKKAADRSWKPMWVLLKGHALYLFKDKASATSSSPTGGTEEQPISVKSCMVDIAYDYTKRKNVFRLTTYNGSEYLFQTDDHESMIDWIKAIQANNDPDEDVQNKLTKSIPSKTPALRSKSPASHSPSIRPKKASDKDHVESPKSKDSESKGNRTWKGRMAKKFRRYGSSSSAPAEAESETEVTGTFCVHLELTPPSTFSEFIPSVVELCTKVVEERGLENQGIYRVPGNTGAVNILQEEINKDPYGQDTDCDKWLDVNVVSSLLKSFFRKLPESLITDDLYDHIIAANRTENPEKRMLKIKKVLHELPDHNFETFRYIAQHLSKVSDMGHVNKMYARNLAIVFGPTLVRKKDESMVSMVKDMSDQCRIVESIIMHPDWFFSSWDVDDHVPVDNEGDDCVPVSGMNQELLSKAEHLELGERGRDLSAKDLVSSIISAANRKKKKKDKSVKSMDTIEPDVPSTGSEPSYNERNIDREIELRRVKEQLQEESETVMSTIKESVSSTSVVSSSSSTGSAATVVSSNNMNKQTVASVSVQETKDSPDKQGVYSAKMVLVKRKDSEDSSSSTSTSEETRSGAKRQPHKYPAYQHEGFRSYVDPNKPSMHRRFSEDVLSERRGDDEVAQRFGGRSNYQTQQHMRRLQIETQQLRQKEEERRAAQERLALDKRRVEMEMAKTRAELEEEEREERSRQYDKADTSSITSDYSTTSSNATAHDGKPHSSTTPLSSHSDYSSNASPASLRYQDSHAHHMNSSMTTKELQHSIRDDLELYRRSRGAPSDFDTSRVAGKGTLSRKKGPPNASVRRMIEEDEDLVSVETFQRSGSYKRKGSLDSLREAYAAGERSCASSDSEHTDDMVKSLSTAFDQKLKTYTSSSDQQKGDSGLGAPEGSSAQGMFILPKPLPYGHLSQGELARFGRGDAKVGIASRFERKNSSSGSSVASGHSPLHKSNTADHTYAQLSSPAAAQRPGQQESGNDESKTSHSWNSSDNRTAISKSEKTDANRQQQVRDAQTTDYVAALRKSSEKIFGSREQLLQNSDEDTASRRRDPTKKRAVARRHTVGGTNDPEHFRALMSVNQSQDDSMCESSALDCLQPTSQQHMASHNLKWWMEQERRRTLGSSPAIFGHCLLQSVPDHVGAGSSAKFTFESAI